MGDVSSRPGNYMHHQWRGGGLWGGGGRRFSVKTKPCSDEQHDDGSVTSCVDSQVEIHTSRKHQRQHRHGQNKMHHGTGCRGEVGKEEEGVREEEEVREEVLDL